MKYFITYLLVVSTCLGYAQVKELFGPDTLVINLKRTVGFGPDGNSSFGIATKEKFNIEESKAYPVIKNIPEQLTSVQEYFYILNKPQFLYQNYCQGIYSKEYFLNKISERNLDFDIKDTINLSTTPIKCYISFAVGKKSNGEYVYVIDAKNNYDFFDDTEVILPTRFRKEDEAVSAAQYIQLEKYNGNKIVKDSIPVALCRGFSGSDRLDISFYIPEFRYGRFSIHNKDYLIAAQAYNRENEIFILDDRPYFERVNRNKKVLPGQHIQLGNDIYRYVTVPNTFDKTYLVKEGLSSDLDLASIKSAQYGMNAPDIKGNVIGADTLFTLSSLKGKYVYLDFWSTNCRPCIAEFPRLSEIYKAYANESFTIVGIADGKSSKIKELLYDKKVTWPNIDLNAISTKNEGYKILAYPTTFLIDPEGKVIATDLRSEQLLNKLKMLNVKRNN